MTIIAWDGKTLAADRRILYQGHIRTTQKIFKLRFPSNNQRTVLVGISGSCSEGLELIEWYKDGAMPNAYPEFQRGKEPNTFVVIKRHNLVDSAIDVWSYEQSPYPVRFAGVGAAFGSGRDYAIAAMHCGKTAREAVEIASVYQSDCGNGVDTMELD